MSTLGQRASIHRFQFVASVLEDGGNKEWIEMDKRWLEEQKNEFREMDEDHNGVLTKDELLVNSAPHRASEGDRLNVLARLRSTQSCAHRQTDQKVVRESGRRTCR